jgi:hypothetical protein
MRRYKVVIGRSARTLPTRKAEAKIGCKVLMPTLGMPVSYGIA